MRNSRLRKAKRAFIVIRSQDAHKHPYILAFLHTILGPDYYVLP